LENISYPFKKPNILDIKLGTVLYDDAASEEKKERMIKTAKETTSLETGVRITGFEVCNPFIYTYVVEITCTGPTAPNSDIVNRHQSTHSTNHLISIYSSHSFNLRPP
jgi:hypothetical protein